MKTEAVIKAAARSTSGVIARLASRISKLPPGSVGGAELARLKEAHERHLAWLDRIERSLKADMDSMPAVLQPDFCAYCGVKFFRNTDRVTCSDKCAKLLGNRTKARTGRW